MSDRLTPLTDEASFSTVYQGELVKASFARDLERKLAEAREALELAAKLPTHQDCPVENHGIVVAALEAIARIDAKGKETA